MLNFPYFSPDPLSDYSINHVMYIVYFSCCVVDVTANYHNSRDGQERLVHLFGKSRHVSTRDAAVANGVNRGLAGSSEAILRVDTLNTVGGVDVLDEGDLPAGSTTLAGSDGGSSKEVLPDLNNVSLMLINLMQEKGAYAEPSLAVLGFDLLTVAHPVTVPPPESGRVVNANRVNALDLKTGTLEFVDDEAKGSASVGTGENVLVHEETPDEILVLPRLAETSDL